MKFARAFPIFLATLVFLSLPLPVQAQFDFTTNNGAITITDYTGTNPVVVIPSSTNGLPVTGIGEEAFFYGVNPISILIPDSVTSIGAYAFELCNLLTNITVPDSIVSIGNGVFEGCSSLTGIVMPTNITSIGSYAFASCTSLTAIYFQGNNPSLGSGAFYGDTNATVYYSPGATGWGTTFGGLPTLELPYTFIITNGAITITGYHGPEGAATVPSSIGLPVTSIGFGAFSPFWASSAFTTSVTIPNSVTSIGNQAFEEDETLTSVTFGSGVTNIGSDLFGVCPEFDGLTVSPLNLVYSSVNGVLYDKNQTTLILCPEGIAGNVTIPDTVTSIGVAAFYNCGLASVTIPDSVTDIGYDAFAGAFRLASVTIPDGVTNIEDEAFAYCGVLSNVEIGTNVTTIGGYAFIACALTNVIIPDSVTSIEGYAFSNCGSLTNITIPNSVTNLDGFTFVDCDFTSITLPDTINNIGDNTFQGCAGLTSITIPNSVISIGSAAFAGCTSLTNITIPNSVTSIGSEAFISCSNLESAYFKSDAPLSSPDVFPSDDATVYYLPGAVGWSNTFDNLPAVLWNPLIQTGGPSFGFGTNGFGFNITGTTNIPIVVEASANLANPVWTPLQTCTLTNGSIYFSDPQWTNYPNRFYRISSP